MDCNILILLQHKEYHEFSEEQRLWMGWCTRRSLKKNIYSIRCQKCSSCKGTRETSLCCIKYSATSVYFVRSYIHKLNLKTHMQICLHVWIYLGMLITLVAHRLLSTGFQMLYVIPYYIFPVLPWLSDPLEICAVVSFMLYLCPLWRTGHAITL